MPIYEYQCPRCGVFEVTQRITEDQLQKCPTCRSKVKKLISNTSFQLKGSGWYVTDYARKGGGADSGAGSASEGGSPKSEASSKSSDGESKSESKSETKSSEGKASGSKSEGKKGGKSQSNAKAA